MLCPHCGKNIMVTFRKEEGKSPTVDNTGVGELLAKIDDELLTDEWEVNFIRDQRARYAKHGKVIYMSAKQMDKLRRIATECDSEL